jgi:hypothetical protein
LTFFHNRTLSATRSRVPGSLRIAFVGDSTTYGAGLQYRETLAARVAAHLNGALPDVWVECLAFGSPGACAYSAVGRVITHVLPLAPDIVVLCLCRNDAIMLAAQPDSAEALRRTWVDFEPMLRTTLETFHDVAAEGRARALVVFHDSVRDVDGMSMPDALGRLCADVGTPFVDGTAAIKGYAHKDLVVSVADPHLNALGNDVIARLVAQFIIGRRWAPASTGFEDPAWIHAAERVARARVEGGMPSALVFGETVAGLDSKWMHRRNTSRARFESQYAAVRARLLEAHRSSLSELADAACGRVLRAEHPLWSINWGEAIANDAMTASFALEHLVRSGSSDGVLEHLGHLRADDAPSATDLEASQGRWGWLRESAAHLRLALSEIGARSHRAHDASPDRQFLTFWTSRVAQWCYIVERCSQRYVDLLPRLREPDAIATVDLIAFVDVRAREIVEVADRLVSAVNRVSSLQRGAGDLAGTAALVLELVVSAPSGSGQWTVNIGVEAYAPAFTEWRVGCFNIIRDGQPHVYRLDIPVMLVGDIHMQVIGQGLSQPDHGLKIFGSSRLGRHNDETGVPLPPVRVESAASDTIALVSRTAQSLPFAT